MSSPFDPQSVAAFSDEVARNTAASASGHNSASRYHAARRFVRRVSRWIERTDSVAIVPEPGGRGRIDPHAVSALTDEIARITRKNASG